MMNVARALSTGVSKQIAFEERALSGQDEIAAPESRFAALVERQSRLVFRIAYAVLRNSHDGEDAERRCCTRIRAEGAVPERRLYPRWAVAASLVTCASMALFAVWLHVSSRHLTSVLGGSLRGGEVQAFVRAFDVLFAGDGAHGCGSHGARGPL